MVGALHTDKQQLKAKMLAAGATQALRLFNNPLCEMLVWIEQCILSYNNKLAQRGRTIHGARRTDAIRRA